MFPDDTTHEYDVFISYAHLDAEHDVASAQMLGNWLDDEGYDVWWDRHLLFGDVSMLLEQKVKRARLVIVLWSPQAAKSEWVARESEWAAKGNKLAPVIIEDHPLMPGWDRFLWLKLTNFQTQKEELRRRLPPPSLARGVAASGLPTPARAFVGRKEELAQLARAWNSTAADADKGSKTNVVALCAIGGAGKSALVQEFLRPLSNKQCPGAHTIFAWSAYSRGSGENRNASADDFIARALRFFGHDLKREPIQDAVERGRQLAKLVADRRALLILDGIEPLQDGPHINHGRLRDRGLAEFITMLGRENKGLLVITSRQPLPELATIAEPLVISKVLERTSSSDGVKLLGTLGVHGKRSELERAVEEVIGHALTLNLLGAFLSAVHGGDINRRDQFRLGDMEDILADFAGDQTVRYARRAARIMESTIARLEDAGDDAEISILHMVSLFDRPADEKALSVLLAEPVIPGLTDAFHAIAPQKRAVRWNVALNRLRKLRLLNFEDPHEPGGLDAHPIVRAHFEARLRHRGVEAFRNAHSRLYDFYRYKDLPVAVRWPEAYALLADATIYPGETQALVNTLLSGALDSGIYEKLDHLPPTLRTTNTVRLLAAGKLIGTAAFGEALKQFQASDLEGMLSCFQAIAHGCAAGRHEEAYREVYLPRVRRGRQHFINVQLGAQASDLAALACFFDEIWSTPVATLSEDAKSYLLSTSADTLRAVGRIRDALPCSETGLRLYTAAGDQANAATSAGIVSELNLLLGDVAAAVRSAQVSVNHSDRTDRNDAQEWPSFFRTTLAHALHQGGAVSEAAELYKHAEDLHTQAFATRWLVERAGFRFCDLLLAQGRARDVIERARYSVEVAKTRNWLLEIGLDNLSLGRAHTSLLPRRNRHGATSHIRSLFVLMARVRFAASRAFATSNEQLARTHLDAAVDRLRRANREDWLPAGLLARAAFRRVVGELDSAAIDLIEAREISTRGQMRLHLADYHLESARLALTQLEVDARKIDRNEAEEHYAAAQELISGALYERRTPELVAIRVCLSGDISPSILDPDRDSLGRPATSA